MTDWLVKRFVKEYEETGNNVVRTRYGMLASVVGIFCNVLLFLIKISIGFVLRSISVMADAFNNLSDAGSSIISFVGVRIASKPADKDHPFGHGRIEYISALVVSFLVIEVGFTFFERCDSENHASAGDALSVDFCYNIIAFCRNQAVAWNVQ